MVAKLTQPRPRPWTKGEYYEAAERGWFDRQRVELLEGEIIERPPQGHSHVAAVHRLYRALSKVFEPAHWVRIEAPFSAMDLSEPEPDMLVAEHEMGWYEAHPDRALLAVEVSDSTLATDRRKAGIYAAAGVPEYWIVNLVDRVVEVHREPTTDAGASTGWRYAAVEIVPHDGELRPLAAAQQAIAVKDLME